MSGLQKVREYFWQSLNFVKVVQFLTNGKYRISSLKNHNDIIMASFLKL